MKKIFSAIICGAVALLNCHAAPTVHSTIEHPSWSRNAVIYEVNLRQYSAQGTIRAFAEQLPRLRDLGVDILWFMPIHPISVVNRKGELGSYYAVQNYKAFNPEFGTIAEFKAVVAQAHSLGMKVIIDWVPNHTGCDNVWVARHPDWYAKNDEGKMYGPFDWTDTYKLDYSNRAMRAAMIDAMQFWLREADIDGFRCDVAGQVPVDFWNEARPQLQAVKRDIFMLAEATEPELTEHCFDMAYNWPMKDLFSAIAATAGQYTFVAPGQSEPRTFDEAHAADIPTLLAQQAEQYPTDSYMMNMITNHDLNSWEGTEFERLGALQGAFAVLSYTLPGMPLIYTGQETGLNRALQFFVKDTPPQWQPTNNFFKFYKELNKIKHTRPELAAGEQGGAVTVYPTASPDVLVFSRTKGSSSTLVAVNLGKEPQELTFTGATPAGPWRSEYVAGLGDYEGAALTLPAKINAGGFIIFMN